MSQLVLGHHPTTSEQESLILSPRRLHHPVNHNEVNSGRLVVESTGFGRTIRVFPVNETDPDHMHAALETILSRGYQEHNVRPGTHAPLEEGPNVSTTFIAHNRPSPLLRLRIPDYYGGTLTIQYGHDNDGNPVNTEMGNLLRPEMQFYQFAFKATKNDTTFYDKIQVDPEHFAEFKRLTLIDQTGNVNMGIMEVPQLILLIQSSLVDAKTRGVDTVAAMISPHFARALHMMGLEFSEIQGVTLDWLREENPEYFYTHRNYFINEKVAAATWPHKVIGKEKGKPVLADYHDELMQLVYTVNFGGAIEAYEAAKLLERLSKPKAYIAKTEYLYTQTERMARNWQKVILRQTLRQIAAHPIFKWIFH